MKFKYFLRGIGIGVLFSAIIFLVAYQTIPQKKPTDAEIIKMAKELGMVEENDTLGKLIENNSEETSTEEVTTEQTTKAEQDVTTEQESTKQSTADVPETTEVTTYEITVAAGSSSYPVCQQLEQLGLIDNAQAYDDYLIEHGYASKISVGTHILKKGMSDEEIAIAISDKD